MIDLELLRKNRQIIDESQNRRFKTLDRVDECVELDKNWKSCNYNKIPIQLFI